VIAWFKVFRLSLLIFITQVFIIKVTTLATNVGMVVIIPHHPPQPPPPDGEIITVGIAGPDGSIMVLLAIPSSSANPPS